MIESRYEEYVRFNNGIPFVFHDRLVRHDSMGGRMANWHENLELQLCEAGSGSVVLDGRRSTLAIGTVVVVNSNVIHRTDPDGELVYSCVILDSEFCRRAGIDIKTLAFRELIEDEALSRIFGEIRCAYAATDDPCRTARLQALALSLLIILRGRYTQGERGQSEGISSCVKSAIVYIRTHFEEPISLESVAGAIYVNKYVLARRFKAATGQSVVASIHACRCTHAAALLEKGATVGEAARACGFSNLSFFSKIFLRYMGKLPGKWKK